MQKCKEMAKADQADADTTKVSGNRESAQATKRTF